MINLIREHPRKLKISIIFGIFNVILPILLVTWFFNRATDVRHPILWFSQGRDETNLWLTFFTFVVLLTVISLVQIKVFRITRHEIKSYYIPCTLALGFVILNLLIPCWLFGWAMQDFADRGLGIYSDAPNPNNPVRPHLRMIFAFVVPAMIISTQIIALRAYLSRH